jgi:hypothetical protein
MDPEVDFFFFLAAIVCFVLAALGDTWRYGGRTRRGLAPLVALMPLGLALAVVPFFADAAQAAF